MLSSLPTTCVCAVRVVMSTEKNEEKKGDERIETKKLPVIRTDERRRAPIRLEAPKTQIQIILVVLYFCKPLLSLLPFSLTPSISPMKSHLILQGNLQNGKCNKSPPSLFAD